MQFSKQRKFDKSYLKYLIFLFKFHFIARKKVLRIFFIKKKLNGTRKQILKTEKSFFLLFNKPWLIAHVYKVKNSCSINTFIRSLSQQCPNHFLSNALPRSLSGVIFTVKNIGWPCVLHNCFFTHLYLSLIFLVI